MTKVFNFSPGPSKLPQVVINKVEKAVKEYKKTGKSVLEISHRSSEFDEILNEINFDQVKFGVMIETPAAVQQIQKLCEEKIKFISFGTNDLTQYILAVDRGNPEVQNLYDEMNPAILHQLEYVIRVCKRNNVETSICGQAGSKKEMVKFLVEKEIDSISVNADMAKEISDYVAELEKEKLRKHGEEPRQYQPEQKPTYHNPPEKSPQFQENIKKETPEVQENTQEESPKIQETNIQKETPQEEIPDFSNSSPQNNEESNNEFEEKKIIRI